MVSSTCKLDYLEVEAILICMRQTIVTDFNTMFSNNMQKPEAVPSSVVVSTKEKRVLGTFDGFAEYSEIDGGKITEVEFLSH